MLKPPAEVETTDGPKAIQQTLSVTPLVGLGVLLAPGLALAQPVTLSHIEFARMSFPATGAVRVAMTYSCPAGFTPPADQGTILVVLQYQDGDAVAGAPSPNFADKIVCDGQVNHAVVRIHGANGFNASDRMEFIVNFSVQNADGDTLGGEDADTVRPTVAPDPATTLADADMKRIAFTLTGAVRAHISYICPSRFHALQKRSRIFVTQVDANGDQRSAIRYIADLVVCDGTRHSASARVPSRGDAFVATRPIHALVDITVARRTGVTLLLGNGKDVLVEQAS